ncbi:MAG: excinuclease ABC subunit UvrC [Clostridia bacterium]|nr:excinuclease ABC subunit UvrC [Clostridia bacterium]
MSEISKNIDHLREKSAALPRTPGVYIMQNEAGKVIYVGKSRSLRDRVSQYFHGAHDPKTEKMAASVHDFRFITCDTEMEALALENSLIKQYTPKYNIKLKDAKSYPYIRINIKSLWPRITMTRKRIPDGSLYFGPYSSTSTVYGAIAQLERTLGIPTCKKSFPEDIGKERPCVYYQIGRCMGVCTGNVDPADYREAIERAAGILRGGTRDVILELTKKMTDASEELEFESAARYRDAIEALRKLGERQKAVGSPDVECDVIGLHLTGFDGEAVKFKDCATVFYVRSGYIADSEHFLFGGDEITFDSGDDNGDSTLSAFLMSLYQSREYIPGEILLSFEIPEHDRLLLSDYLTERAEHKVTIRTPKKGASKYLCDMAVSDAAIHSENSAKRDKNDERTLASLASLLCLEVLPERIEAYDISNLGDEHITAGMVVAVNGRMKKSEYRTFKIRNKDTQDDYAAMTEAVSRRLEHIGAGENDSMNAYPDLILLDGGKGHVGVIRELLRQKGFDIPVFGMVKDEHHKTRTLTDEEGEINIARQADVFRLIYGIQEEVHRYTVSRMTNAKRKTLKTSSLEQIKGIGPAKAKALTDHFGSLAKLKNADEAALRAVTGISEKDASAVWKHFHPKAE